MDSRLDTYRLLLVFSWCVLLYSTSFDLVIIILQLVTSCVSYRRYVISSLCVSNSLHFDMDMFLFHTVSCNE